VIAHRGASAIAPENTLLAFQLAIEAGADMIETDAHLARDGSIVLIHDAELDRTTNCLGVVADRPATDLRSCDAGYWFTHDGDQTHPFRGIGLGVPALDALFSLLDTLDPTVQVNVEIKNMPGELTFDPSERLATRLVEQLHAIGAAHRVIVSSFNPASIDCIKQLDPSIRTGYICAPSADVHARTAYAVARGHNAIHPHHTSLGSAATAARVVKMIRQAGLEVNVWTVNDPERMRELAVADVDGIITDDPQQLHAVLDERWA
jgi:glycerophosphoryl diester phosphodiesterase